MTGPGYGRPSPAAAAEPVLAPAGDATGAGWRAEAASTAWCSLRAASVAGVRHRLSGARSDDAFAWAHDGDRVAVAVADGLGSVGGSADTSRRAVSAAVTEALARAGDDLMVAATCGVDAANRAAFGGGATTLVVAVADRGGEVALARIGDSSAFALKPDGDWVELFAAPDPDRSDTATAALPAAEPAAETAASGMWDGAVMVLATDGVADPWRDGPTTVAPSLVEALLARPSAVELLATTDFSRQGCHDDRTLVCLWARPRAGDGEGE